MDWFDQPAAPVQPSPDSTPSRRRLTLGPARRGAATLLLALGLLAIGGGAVVFAADPSTSPAPSTTAQPSTGTRGGTTTPSQPNGSGRTDHSSVNCPNKGGSGNGGSTAPSTAPSTDGSTSSPSSSDL
jgi:hypothetical protein